MRKIVADLFCTIDGVVEAPEQWHGPYHNEVVGQTMQTGLDAADTMLLGRNTYQAHAGFWPSQSDPMAERMNGIHKVLFSTTVTDPQWQNTTLAKGTVLQEATRLRGEPGRDILISGSPGIVRELIREGLLDELRLIVDPIIPGTGRRLLERVGEVRFELVESKPYDTGALRLIYHPVRP